MNSPMLNNLFRLFKNDGNPLTLIVEDNPEWGFRASLKTKTGKEVIYCVVQKIEDVHTFMEDYLIRQSAELFFNQFPKPSE